MVGDPEFIGKVVHDRGIGTLRSGAGEISRSLCDKVAQPVVPGTWAHPIDGVLRGAAQERAPLLLPCARKRALGDGSADLVGACEPAQVSPEAIWTP